MSMISLAVPAAWMLFFFQTAQEPLPPIEVSEETPVDRAWASYGPPKPVPITNPGTWVTSADYPSWAIRNGLDGIVGFTLSVDELGAVTQCRVTRSSGSPELDRIACERLQSRAAFRPAIGADGNPINSNWSNQVRFEIPAPPPKIPTAGELVYAMTVEADGTVSRCEVLERSGGALSSKGDPCRNVPKYKPVLGDDGAGQRTEVVIRRSVEHRVLE